MNRECEILKRAIEICGKLNCRELCDKYPLIDDPRVIPPRKPENEKQTTPDISDPDILQLIKDNS